MSPKRKTILKWSSIGNSKFSQSTTDVDANSYKLNRNKSSLLFWSRYDYRCKNILCNEQSSFSNSSETPTLLKGWCKHWEASKKWSTKYLAETFGDAIIPISSYNEKSYQPTEDRLKVKLSDYLAYLEGFEENELLTKDAYLAGWHFMKNAPEVMGDIEVPEVFRNNIIGSIIH